VDSSPYPTIKLLVIARDNRDHQVVHPTRNGCNTLNRSVPKWLISRSEAIKSETADAKSESRSLTPHTAEMRERVRGDDERVRLTARRFQETGERTARLFLRGPG
jgi:hypothetical protein